MLTVVNRKRKGECCFSSPFEHSPFLGNSIYGLFFVRRTIELKKIHVEWMGDVLAKHSLTAVFICRSKLQFGLRECAPVSVATDSFMALIGWKTFAEYHISVFVTHQYFRVCFSPHLVWGKNSGITSHRRCVHLALTPKPRYCIKYDYEYHLV